MSSKVGINIVGGGNKKPQKIFSWTYKGVASLYIALTIQKIVYFRFVFSVELWVEQFDGADINLDHTEAKVVPSYKSLLNAAPGITNIAR